MADEPSSEPVENGAAHAGPLEGEVMDLDEERIAFGRIVHAMSEYQEDANWEVKRWEYNYSLLPPEHQTLLPGLPAKFAAARQCIEVNQFFIKTMLSVFDEDLGAPPHLAGASAAAAEYAATSGGRVSPQDADKVRYVFKNLMRDWSAEGAAERQQSYGRMLQEIEQLFEGRQQPGMPPVRVLVPGAGLGRLCLELASRGLPAHNMLTLLPVRSPQGFAAHGNEFSYYMLITSSFMLNCSTEPEQWTIFPWVLNNVNQLSDADQLRPVRVPDVAPCDMVGGPGLMSMCAGDFCEVYRKEEYRGVFDCVATCFFIDTAHNVIDYLHILHAVLKPGGYWVNLGPLLYHWADSHTYLPEAELSIELALEDVERIATQIGFKQLKKAMVPCNYMTNMRSMLRNGYQCVFSTWQKPTEPNGDHAAAGTGG